MNFSNVLYYFQVLITLVCPGQQPETVQKKRRSQTSHFIQVFSDSDHMMDAPTFPIVLVSNGIHHIVPTRLITIEKLLDWRKGLAFHNLNQVKALWSEPELDYMLIKNPDSEFSAVITQNLNKLQSAIRLLLQKRADKATGLKLSTDCTCMPHDPAFGVKYSFKGLMIAKVCPDLPTEADLEVATTPVGPALSAPACCQYSSVRVPQPSQPPFPTSQPVKLSQIISYFRI